jgi:hypothetical protein
VNLAPAVRHGCCSAGLARPPFGMAAAHACLPISTVTGTFREYLHKRIAEEHAQLERLKKSEEEQYAEVLPLSTGEHCDMTAGE